MIDLTKVPSELHPMLSQAWQDFTVALEQHALKIDDDFFNESAAYVWGCSDFILQTCLRQPKLIVEITQSSDLHNSVSNEYYKNLLSQAIDSVNDVQQLMQALRYVRAREMLRIAWRDLSGLANLKETLADLSNLAECCISFAIKAIQKIWQPVYGLPYDQDAAEQSLIVLALGKLGGSELNFSSDLDLILSFYKHGATQGGRKSIDNEQYFTRLARELIKCLNETTEDGFVFRIDLRLRPFGESGPIVLSYNALETYYQEQGREWERYALVKARVLNSTTVKPIKSMQEYRKMLSAFIYRKYIDYGVIDSLRDLKKLMDREARQETIQDNIKRGSGGIRELEFIIQAMQIIRGGKEIFLQQNQFLIALERLAKRNYFKPEVISELQNAYCFLRDLENRIQIYQDRQTQQLPTETIPQLRLALAMQFESWDELIDKLNKHRTNVSKHFAAMIAPPESEVQGTDISQELVQDLKNLWLGNLNTEDVNTILDKLSFTKQAADICEQLSNFSHSTKIKVIRPIGRQRLNELIPLILLDLVAIINPELALTRILNLLEAVSRRSAYLSLLLENPKARKQLIKLLSLSQWIATEVTNYPLLLDELLDQQQLFKYMQYADFADELQQRLLLIPEQDLEQQLQCLGQFKHGNMLRVACADVMQKHTVEQVSEQLSAIADLILTHILSLAWSQMLERFGYPQDFQGNILDCDFAIIAYGKLGSRELSYSSDLDLVFLHGGFENCSTQGPKEISNGEFYARLGQKISHLLGMHTSIGKLYELDLRLRPSGAQGLLVSSIEAFTEYQNTKAWVWEHQALLRARVIAGSAHIQQSFTQVREQVLQKKRDQQDLKQEITTMRIKMREQASKSQVGIQLKQAIVDVEFIVQYNILLWANKFKKLSSFTENIRALEYLHELDLITSDDCQNMINALKIFRHELNLNYLGANDNIHHSDKYYELLKKIDQLWMVNFGDLN